MVKPKVDLNQLSHTALPGILAISLVLSVFFSVASPTQSLSLTPDAVMTTISGSGLACYNTSFAGMVYILPSSASTQYWYQKYGDRLYFYVHANLEDYRTAITYDFNIIAKRYRLVIIVVPADDLPSYYQNLRIMDELAVKSSLRILYGIFPKEKYGAETDYLTPKTAMHTLVLDNMRLMSQLRATFGVGVWYGWRGRLIPQDIRSFHASLPQDIRRFYLTWIDSQFVARMVDRGLPGIAKELDIQVATELYSNREISRYAGTFHRQIVITGLEDCVSASDWRSAIRDLLSKTSCTLVEPRVFAAWIFWDQDDGSRENLTAYINGELQNPF